MTTYSISPNDIEFANDHQVITFPDQRYRMSFAWIQDTRQNEEIALDSCTITLHRLAPTGGRRSLLFFDKLRFDQYRPALYGNGMIQPIRWTATNPVLNLHVKIDSRRRTHAPPVRMEHTASSPRCQYAPEVYGGQKT